MYDSYWTYLEMIAAALANFFGQTLFVIAEQNAKPATLRRPSGPRPLKA